MRNGDYSKETQCLKKKQNKDTKLINEWWIKDSNPGQPNLKVMLFSGHHDGHLWRYENSHMDALAHQVLRDHPQCLTYKKKKQNLLLYIYNITHVCNMKRKYQMCLELAI